FGRTARQRRHRRADRLCPVRRGPHQRRQPADHPWPFQRIPNSGPAQPDRQPEAEPSMSTVASVLTTKDGQGSSTFALSLAWTAAEEHRVMLVDADMSGTGNLADLIALDFGARGVGNLFGTLAISAIALEQQAVIVRQKPRLRVGPGLNGFCCTRVAVMLWR